jgi:hypothetical protein
MTTAVDVPPIMTPMMAPIIGGTWKSTKARGTTSTMVLRNVMSTRRVDLGKEWRSSLK